MPEIDRTRDLIILKKGDCYVVAISPSLARSGWVGGQGAVWYDAGRDEMTVTASDGAGQGFFVWGSSEDGDQYTAMTGYQPAYGFAVLGFGGWLISTRSFERYTWASRQVGPLVPITYAAQDEVVFSLRGLFTNEDEWTLAGDPRAPNDNILGVVTQPPSALTNNYITLQIRV
jgi:hypothetical protein